jgi:hypothetical protein
MRNVLFIFVLACGDDIRQAPPDCTEHPADASADDAAIDSSNPDAQECWMLKTYPCGNEIFQVCVPYTGCSTFTCNGETLGYCGPGTFSDAGV